MVTITLNGKEYTVDENQTIIQAAIKHGIEIPYFCWHPKLSVSGNCRMCLVEVEKMPKLVIACMTKVTDGMVINTDNERVVTARQAVMEFLLINHPLDCPICDEAGECKLQDYAYTYSRGVSRFDETKVHKPKRVPLGPRVMLDVERCIMCSRCIRFGEEVAKQPALTFTERGDHVVLTTFPDQEFDNPYSMNVIDICPVGALTSRDFRFRSRVWEMASTESVCIGCARGCNTYVWTRNNQVMRLTPRINEAVNEHWMCDAGRLTTYKFVNDDLRIREPVVKKDGKSIEVSWEDAITTAAAKLKSFKPKEIAVIASPYSTNEESYLLKKFAEDVLKAGALAYPEHIVDGDEDDILIRADKTPNSTGLRLLGFDKSAKRSSVDGIMEGIRQKKIKCLFVMHEDPASDDAMRKVLEQLDLLIVHSWGHTKTTVMADIVFSGSTYAELHGTVTNFEGRIQRLKPAIVTKGHRRALEGLSMSRWDAFGTTYDKWGRGPIRNALPAWEAISRLANAMGAKFRYQRADDVFADMAASVPSLKNLSVDSIGRYGRQVSVEKDRVKIS
jgi:NADH-quinone oxidoreductase subunit G